MKPALHAGDATFGPEYIDCQGRDFKELGSYGLTTVGDENYHWTLILLSGQKYESFVKIHKDEHGLFHVAFEKEAPSAFGAFTSRNTAFRALRDFADKNGLSLKINHVSNDGSLRLRENPRAI